jgi:hypothetical protein
MTRNQHNAPGYDTIEYVSLRGHKIVQLALRELFYCFTPAAHGLEELFSAVLCRKVPRAHSQSACFFSRIRLEILHGNNK